MDVTYFRVKMTFYKIENSQQPFAVKTLRRQQPRAWKGVDLDFIQRGDRNRYFLYQVFGF